MIELKLHHASLKSISTIQNQHLRIAFAQFFYHRYQVKQSIHLITNKIINNPKGAVHI